MNTEIWNLYNEINNSYKKDLLNEEENSFNEIINDKSFVELNERKCINCKEKDFLMTDNEIVVCTYCGVENGNIIDYNAEWRYYGSDDNKKSSDPNRCGVSSNAILEETSLSTVILGKGFEVFRKLNSWNGLSYKQRSLLAVLNKISLKANIDNVPQSIVDSTINMYKTISKDYIKRGASRESLIAACFFNALRDEGMIRSTNEVAKLFDIKSKKFSKGCNEFTELMFHTNREYIKNIKPIDSKDLIQRFCTILNIDEKYINISITCANIIDKLGLCQENNPKSIAVGIIYLVSQNYNLNFTKKDIAEQCKTSEVTVNNTYGQIIRFKKYLLPLNISKK